MSAGDYKWVDALEFTGMAQCQQGAEDLRAYQRLAEQAKEEGFRLSVKVVIDEDESEWLAYQSAARWSWSDQEKQLEVESPEQALAELEARRLSQSAKPAAVKRARRAM